VAKGIRTGVLSVNSSHSVHTEAPFGGFKRSGIGREMGMHAVSLYTEVKNVYFSESEQPFRGPRRGPPRLGSERHSGTLQTSIRYS
jgi:hypothetical protein